MQHDWNGYYTYCRNLTKLVMWWDVLLKQKWKSHVILVETHFLLWLWYFLLKHNWNCHVMSSENLTEMFTTFPGDTWLKKSCTFCWNLIAIIMSLAAETWLSGYFFLFFYLNMTEMVTTYLVETCMKLLRHFLLNIQEMVISFPAERWLKYPCHFLLKTDWPCHVAFYWNSFPTETWLKWAYNFLPKPDWNDYVISCCLLKLDWNDQVIFCGYLTETIMSYLVRNLTKVVAQW